jgi:hypothetical protein
MTKSLASPTQPKIGAETMEKVLIQGDLKALTPLERVAYYDPRRREGERDESYRCSD